MIRPSASRRSRGRIAVGRPICARCCHRRRGRCVRREELEALDGRRHHRQLALRLTAQGVGRGDPLAGDRLVVVVARRLPGGATARKKRVSKRRGASPTGVIQWLTHTRSSMAGRSPCWAQSARRSTAAVVHRLAVRQRWMTVADHLAARRRRPAARRPPRSTPGSRRSRSPRRPRRRPRRPSRRGRRTCRWRTPLPSFAAA